MAVDIFSFPLVIFLPYLAVMTSWVIRSKTSPTKPGKLSFPAYKQRGDVPSDVVTSILILERRYFQVMEKLLLWVEFSPLSSGARMAAWMRSPLALLVGQNRSGPVLAT